MSNIDLPDDGTCAFCAYLRGERPFTILARTALTATLVTREQRGYPHLLILPVRHISTVLDLTNEEASALMIAVRDAAHAIDECYARPGIAVWQNNGVPAGQAISHVHFHVAGTLDVGGTEWGDVPELSVADTDDIADRLRSAFKRP
ncbi:MULTISPECIES: HIT family protein [unclassified Caballeronia]|uniref:HIT family protein n=1 Tax=unclassified Caballeronia TaxID=2646786 RepID=UPI00285B42F1|nr:MULTISPECIES: HIT family protein [unclassified Caballeronia]MDR5771146.1 HIT family protein [Caballeronia sp. LZ002]MDR5802365.1 HIT family protein [Caballeronia sp. LZ001]MDR5846583.1 HIT family protein [Caballeronia sp. LZ003]